MDEIESGIIQLINKSQSFNLNAVSMKLSHWQFVYKKGVITLFVSMLPKINKL